MQFTIWKTKNGWIVLKGNHTGLDLGDMSSVHVFTTALKLSTWLSKQK